MGQYSLKISSVYYDKGNLVCLISDRTNVNPYEVYASELFMNDNLLSQIKPRELLKLKEMYDVVKNSCVYLMETHRDNKYKILHHDREFLMCGKDICMDINLFKSMRFEDAFKIIYETAAWEAVKNYIKLKELQIELKDEKNNNFSDNVILLNVKNPFLK